MAWEWLDSSFGLGDEPEPAAKPLEPPRHAPKIESCVAVVRHPSHEGDVGSVIDCHYFVDDSELVICEQSGKVISRHELAPGDDPKATARKIKRAQWQREQNSAERVPGFGRPLRYRDLGLA